MMFVFGTVSCLGEGKLQYSAYKLKLVSYTARDSTQLAGAVEYTDSISAEG